MYQGGGGGEVEANVEGGVVNAIPKMELKNRSLISAKRHAN